MSHKSSNKHELLMGAHVSGSGGLWQAYEHAESLEATCMQIFTANQMQWHPKAPNLDDIEKFKQRKKSSPVKSVVSHDSYLINLCATDEKLLKQSINAFGEEIKRCVALGIDYMNFHPGSHKEKGVEWGISTIAQACDEVRPLYKDTGLKLLLETTAGQGSSVGYRFEEIAEIIHQVKDSKDLGVCVDTCHIFAAGYDIRTASVWEKTWQEFERIIGLKKLFAMHVNDSKKPLGSRVDRHAELGQGEIGMEAFRLLVNDERLNHLPLILETPGGMEGFKQEIQMLRNMYGKKKT